METPSPHIGASDHVHRQLSSREAVVEGLKDVAFGSIAGMVSKVFEHPFDLAKVRLQSQVLDKEARFSGPMDCLKQTWKNEGFRGLYRGLPAPVVGAMAENATLFMAYGQLQHVARWLSGSNDTELPFAHRILAAAGAGTITSFVLTPIELVKCKMQVQMLTVGSPAASIQQLGVPPGEVAVLGLHPNANTQPLNVKANPQRPKLPGPFAVLAGVVRTHGLKGLWLGQTGTLIRETGGSAAWFGTKELLCSYLLARRQKERDLNGGILIEEDSRPLTRHDLYAWESALAGAVAGISYNVFLFPADSVKSLMQTEEELRPRAPGDAKDVKRPSFFGVAKQMYAKQGIKGLYAGLGVTVARAIPSSAMIFLIYDGLAKRFPS